MNNIGGKIKIAVLGTRGFPDVQGGIEAHCENLYPYLVQKGCEVTVFTRRPYVNPGINSFQGINLISLSCPRNRFLEAIVHTFKGVLAARRISPDILHIHGIGPSLFAPFARALGMKVVVTHHGPDYKRKKWSPPAKTFLKFCERMGMTFANEIIAIAGNISDDIRQKFGRDTAIIPNGVEIPFPADTEETLQKYGLKKKRYILAVGRFVPEKGFHDLIEAFIRLQVEGRKSEAEKWKLAIVGSADHEDKYSLDLKATADKYNDIVLTGFLTGRSLQELYSHAGIFVLPSYFEGLPIVLLEAMSYGLSCIAGDIPANRCVELDDGRYFPAGDINTLTQRLKEFINKPLSGEEKKKQTGVIAERYNWEKIADRTLRVYRAV
ncbi:MAG TPA: glycosyltransferase family 1 protein [Nitrospirae bacterium]|nr:glycosyltransferase family 1 protein [Nitrospirota bacterium]HDY99875.1 glycosyltransferase family 1 protein [Nitrospirota bacterium]